MKATLCTTVVVVAPARLVVGNRTAMKSFLLAQLALGVDVILDLEETAVLDSSALGMLISIERSFRMAGRMFVLCALHHELPVLFEITLVDRRIRVAQNVAEARQMLTMPHLPRRIVAPASDYLRLHQ